MSFAIRCVRAACTAQATFASPLGAMLLARTAAGLAGVWFEGQKDHPGTLDAPQRPHDPLLHAAATQLTDYFAGRSERFDLPLDPHGTPFQCRVWQALRGIGSGRTCSYAEIAQQVGSPRAVRAVGAAIGKNPLSVIVPCHRVIGTGGALTGYAGGVARKRALLLLEGVAVDPALGRPGPRRLPGRAKHGVALAGPRHELAPECSNPPARVPPRGKLQPA